MLPPQLGGLWPGAPDKTDGQYNDIPGTLRQRVIRGADLSPRPVRMMSKMCRALVDL